MSAKIAFDSTQPEVGTETPAAGRQRFIELEAELLRHYGAEARSEFVEIGNPAMRVHLLVAGEGEPLVCFHGGDGEAVDWAPLIAELRDDVQLIGVDRPGFGLSDPFDYRDVDLRRHAGDFVASLLDALGFKQATLAGGSMGGYFALSAALDHPKRVKRVILLGMAVGLVGEVAAPLRQLCGTPGAAQAFMQQAASLEAQHRQYEQMFSTDPQFLPELYFRTRLAGLTLPGVQDTWATLLVRFAGLDGVKPGMYFGEELRGLNMPVLIVWGEHDMAPAEVASAAAELIPDCELVTLPGIGHFPFLEAPVRTAELIRGFLKRA